MSARSWSSSLPAAPTNGTPCLSSWKPGASPPNIRSEPGFPEPNTTCVRPPASAHLVQPATTSPKARSSSTLVSSVTAATASAATAAATAERAGLPGGAAARAERAGLPGGADHRERRKLPGDVGRAALRARNLLVPPDELLEVLLALHAHVLVHRHRPGSLGARPDGSQIARGLMRDSADVGH